MQILGIIPARYASTRFPAKALVDIAGKSMIRRVYEQALKADSLADVVVATDHPLIFEHIKAFGGKVVMTSSNHLSGTDRCSEVLTCFDGYEYVINIQGDEPFIHPEQINLLAKVLDGTTEIATLVKKIDDVETLFSPNTPKVVLNNRGEALYFSRQTIPYLRGVPVEEWLGKYTHYKHIGIYAYRADILKQLTQLLPSSLEQAESLEQLRWLEQGYKIKAITTPYDSQGIDTPEDLDKALNLIER
jgi:3-deoxy-manno-octulosonate cytidylyltransferase (CMP-KDO synthetase)